MGAPAKIRPRLGAVPETLLIPLAARAVAPKEFPELGFHDPQAASLLARLDADIERFTSDKLTMPAVIKRAQWFDRIAADFLNRHPDGLVVELGAGLDDRAARIGLPPDAAWVDLDLAEVTALREALLTPRERVATITGDLTNPRHWLYDIGWGTDRPALFLAEGVLMYLSPGEPEALLRALGQAADARRAAIEVAFDYCSPFMASRSARHPSVGKTRARFTWAVASSRFVREVDSAYMLAAHADLTAVLPLKFRVFGFLYRLAHLGARIQGMLHFRRRPASARPPARPGDGSAGRRRQT